MANPKLKPCPRCETDEHLAVYQYESGWRHVECDKCWYLGPGEGSIRQAIKSHNERYDAARTQPSPQQAYRDYVESVATEPGAEV